MITNKEAIKYLIRPIATSTGSCNEYLKQKEAYDLAIKALEERSKERPQAEWLYFEGVSTSGYLECSKCGETDFHKKYSNFCPNCGKYMKNRKGGTE